MSYCIDEANMKLMLIREKLEELIAQEEEEQEQLVSSGKKMISYSPSIKEVDQLLAVVLEKLKNLGESNHGLQSSLSLAKGQTNFERVKAQH